MKEKDEEKDIFLLKHSAAIEVSGKLSLLQRKTWNILLANAYKKLLEKDVHSIKLSDLCEILGYDSNNVKYLVDELEKISDVKIKWDVLGRGGEIEDKGFAHYLASARVSGGTGICRYSFGGDLAEILFNPRIYGQISLKVQKELSSKYALIIYELAKDFYITKKETGFTDYIPIEKLREIFGIEEGEYQDFKVFKRDVLMKAINEVNDKSDIFIEPLFDKRGRKVIAVKFLVRKNPKQLSLLIDSPSGPEMSDAVQALKDRGVTLPIAIDLVRFRGEEACLMQVEHYDFLLEEFQAGRIPQEKTPQSAAWIVTAIQEGWTLPPNFKSKATRELELKLSQLISSAKKDFEKANYESALSFLTEYRTIGGQEEKGLEERIEKAIKDQAEKKATDDYINNLSDTDKKELFSTISDQMKALDGRWRESADKPDSVLFGVHLRNHVKKNILHLS